MLVARAPPLRQRSDMTNNPFGLPESAADRFVREEFERTERYRSILGGGAVAQAIRDATSHRKLVGGLDVHRPLPSVLDTLERDRRDREAFRQMASNSWAVSVAETARSIAERSSDLIEQKRHLSSSVLETVRTFELSRGAVATAIAAAQAETSFRQTIAGSLAQFSIFGVIAERMAFIDTATLRASEGVVQSATALAAEMVLETQRIAEAIAAAPTEEEGGALYGELIEAIIRFVSALGPNTVAELQTMGLIQWFNLIVAVLGLYLAAVPQQPQQSPADKAAFVELNQKVDALQRETHDFLAADARAEEAFVADLPRAELVRDATFRRRPEPEGEVVLKAPKGMVLAIESGWRLAPHCVPRSFVGSALACLGLQDGSDAARRTARRGRVRAALERSETMGLAALTIPSDRKVCGPETARAA